MKKAVRVLGITISALTLAYGAFGAMAQPQSDQQAHSHSTPIREAEAVRLRKAI